MNRSTSIYLVMILLLLQVAVQAQDFRKAFGELRKAQFAIVNLDAEVAVTLYKGTDIAEKQTSIVRKLGNNYYYEMGNTIVANLDKYALTMNKNDLMMWINPRPENEPFFLSRITGANIDSLLDAQVKDVQFMGKTGTVCHYSITTSNNLISGVEYFIDEDVDVLRKMIYYYNPQYVDVYSKVEIIFTKFDTNPAKIASFFNQDRYFTTRNKQFVASGIFENYTIVKK